jgi:hypothetical protein
MPWLSIRRPAKNKMYEKFNLRPRLRNFFVIPTTWSDYLSFLQAKKNHTRPELNTSVSEMLGEVLSLLEFFHNFVSLFLSFFISFLSLLTSFFFQHCSYSTPSFWMWLYTFSSLYSDWLRDGRFGDRIPVGATFSAPVHTDPGAHSACCTMGIGSFPGVKNGRSVTLTLHPLLVPLVMKE